jgi:GNAT superfamily N-acetyltransferase
MPVQPRVAYDIRVTNDPLADDVSIVLETLRAFTCETVPLLDNQAFAALVDDSRGQTIGGLVASSRWGGFHIEMLALPSALRGHGLGSKLLSIAEGEARRRNCHHMLLDTQAFQARAFYERHGFSTFGTIEGPEPYYPRYFMRKQLGSSAP